ncbi:MAG: aconitate hydratase AcnA [Gammaproteobacteria bacterium]
MNNTPYRTVLPGTELDFYDVRRAVDAIQAGAYHTLPYVLRVLAEQLVRRCDPQSLTVSLSQIIERKRDVDFPWYPARVVCHDILGLTALVDLAGLRDVIAEQGGDPSQVNPVTPTQLIVDHSLAVEAAGFDPDSHTPHVDALGVLAIGVGGLEAETVMLGHPSMMRTPEVVGVQLVGARQAGITATDVVLALTAFLRQARVVGAYIEFFGAGVACLTLGDRATISNMTPEFGATAALFYIDQHTLDYLTLTGRDRQQVELVELYAKTVGLWVDDLKSVEYDRVLSFDLSTVVRSLAGPSSPHRRLPTDELVQQGFAGDLDQARDDEAQGLIPDGAVIIAAITSCTNTSNPRNVIAAGLLAKNANAFGLARKPWVKTSFAPGSKVAKLYLEAAGLLPELEQLGFGIVGYACTTCNGMSGALDPAIQREILERDVSVTAVLSGNRNFDGRIHPAVKQAFLASPPLVVAYAIAGTMRFDIENDVLGVVAGKAITLKDLWPSDEAIDAVLASAVKPEQFRQIYIPMFEAKAVKKAENPLFDWHPLSTYIRRPPYWDGALAGERSRRGMRPLAILGDNITTDHLSPSNAILPDSAAGEYLAKMGLPESDFNSYATHRGDHLTAQRATFANPKLLNEMCRDDSGAIIQGSLARLEPEGVQQRMWEVIETYLARKQNLIVIAGSDYGQGSSRDWAAKGVRLAGVEVIVAESFERIHRTNLIGMGILPVQFKSGENRHTLGIDGTETFDVLGEITAQTELTLLIHRKSASSTDSTVRVPVTCRVDTEAELMLYRAGGVLPWFAHKFLMKKVS